MERKAGGFITIVLKGSKIATVHSQAISIVGTISCSRPPIPCFSLKKQIAIVPTIKTRVHIRKRIPTGTVWNRRCSGEQSLQLDLSLRSLVE